MPAVEELLYGSLSLDEARKLTACGQPRLDSWLVLDARSVFEAITAQHIKTPAEKGLLLQLLWLRERLDLGQLGGLAWVDTRDMVSDGLTKGSVDRSRLQELMRGRWTVEHEPYCWRSPLHVQRRQSGL